MRTGADIAFLGGVINYVINSEKWNKDPFFKTFVANYTNAATIISEDFKDTEDLEGGFSGLAPAKGGMPEWPFNALTNQYNGATEQYVREKAGAASPKLELKPGEGFAPLVESMVRPPVIKDPTLQHPRCVLQIVKRHFARYTPERVEEATGCPKESFLKVAETILANSGADKTTSFAYAVAWTQHTYGVQILGACALLQLLLGNVGRAGAGIMALRGHASIQGSTDVPTLYHSIQGYIKTSLIESNSSDLSAATIFIPETPSSSKPAR